MSARAHNTLDHLVPGGGDCVGEGGASLDEVGVWEATWACHLGGWLWPNFSLSPDCLRDVKRLKEQDGYRSCRLYPSDAAAE